MTWATKEPFDFVKPDPDPTCGGLVPPRTPEEIKITQYADYVSMSETIIEKLEKLRGTKK